MVVVNYSGKEINAKIVYYGPGLCGKTTNLEKIYDSVPAANKGKMISMKTKTDRTLFFDFLPLELGEIGGFRTRMMLYTVPGQVFYNATRKLVLKGVDAVVFVADSERGKMRENQGSLENLRENLTSYGIDIDQMPLVFQYNKRDLPDVYSKEELDRALERGSRPMVEAVAAKGDGVFETLRLISKLLLTRLHQKMRGQAAVEESAPMSSHAIAAPAVAPAPSPARSITPETWSAPRPAEPTPRERSRRGDFEPSPSLISRAPAVEKSIDRAPSSSGSPAAPPAQSPFADTPGFVRGFIPESSSFDSPAPARSPSSPATSRQDDRGTPSSASLSLGQSQPPTPLEIVRLDAGSPGMAPGRITVPIEIDLADLRCGEPFELVLRLEVRDRRRVA